MQILPRCTANGTMQYTMRSLFIGPILLSFISCGLCDQSPRAAMTDIRVLDMGTLGRPFFLGMLYDQRTDRLIPGYTLWNASQLNSSKIKQTLTLEDKDIKASDNLGNRYNLFDIKADLKLSLLAGMIELSGSARYLHSEKTSLKQSRVTLKYSLIKRFESVNMDVLGNPTFNNRLDDMMQLATHVVTGVHYGADAMFNFEATTNENEKQEAVAAELEIKVKTIPSFQIEAKGSVDITTTETQFTDRISIQLFSDFDMTNKENPSTFQEAMQLYKELPKMLGSNGEKAIPKRVSLFPLHLLGTKASKLIREISSRLVDDLQKLIQSAEDMSSQANDIQSTQSAHAISYLSSQLGTFQQLKAVFMNSVLQTVAPILPTIRAGGQEESMLSAILERWHASPFSPNLGASWLSRKASEADFLDKLGIALPQVQLTSNLGDVFRYSLSKEHVIALELSVPDEDEYLDLFRAYNDATGNNTIITTTVWNPGVAWHNDPAVNEKIQPLISAFRRFAATNAESLAVQFLIVIDAATKGAAASAQIRYYRSGKEVPNFQLPSSEPLNFNGALVEDEVRLTWSFQDTEWITGFVVSYSSSTQPSRPVFFPKSSSMVASVNTSSMATGRASIKLTKWEVYNFDVRWVMDAGNSSLSATKTIGATKKGSLVSCDNSQTGYDLGREPGFRGYGDVNGDGWPDYCRIIGDNVMACHLGGYDYQYSYLSGRIDSGKARMCEGLFDVNNDGRADFCRVLKSSTNNTLTCLLAGQSGFTQDVTMN